MVETRQGRTKKTKRKNTSSFHPLSFLPSSSCFCFAPANAKAYQVVVELGHGCPRLLRTINNKSKNKSKRSGQGIQSRAGRPGGQRCSRSRHNHTPPPPPRRAPPPPAGHRRADTLLPTLTLLSRAGQPASAAPSAGSRARRPPPPAMSAPRTDLARAPGHGPPAAPAPAPSRARACASSSSSLKRPPTQHTSAGSGWGRRGARRQRGAADSVRHGGGAPWAAPWRASHTNTHTHTHTPAEQSPALFCCGRTEDQKCRRSQRSISFLNKITLIKLVSNVRKYKINNLINTYARAYVRTRT